MHTAGDGAGSSNSWVQDLASLYPHDLGTSLNCLNVLPLATVPRLSRMAVKGFAWEACRLGIDTFDVPLLSKWVQHIGVCGRTPNPSIVGSNPATCARPGTSQNCQSSRKAKTATIVDVSSIPCSSVEEPTVRWFESSHGNK